LMIEPLKNMFSYILHFFFKNFHMSDRAGFYNNSKCGLKLS
jgi:hypothetical protein